MAQNKGSCPGGLNPVAFLLYAVALPAKPAICFGGPKFSLGGPKFSAMPCAELAACSDRMKAQQRRERPGCVAY
jgi:hypothetical protein